MKLMVAALLICLSALAAAYGAQLRIGYPPLPNDLRVNAIGVDSFGDIYVAGNTTANPAQTRPFIAKLNPAATKVMYLVTLSGSGQDYVNALAVAPDGTAYATGLTNSKDFPTTPGSLQPNFGKGNIRGFVVKLDPSGKVLYCTYIGGASVDVAYGSGITVNSAGEAFVVGNVPLLKLDSTGSKALVNVSGFGGSGIAVDAQDYMYVLGATAASDPTVVTPNAFQKTVPFTSCGTTMQFEFPCLHQNVTKLDPTATKVIYSTFVSGTYGESPQRIAVDQSGAVYVAGTTMSTDYPVTAGAFQLRNQVVVPPPPAGLPSFETFPPPTQTGYVTKIDPEGSHLVYSTYLGGTLADQITALRVDDAGRALVAGSMQSPDFPGLSAVPSRCLPGANNPLPFLTRLSTDGSALSTTQLVYGVPTCPGGCAVSMATDTNAKAYLTPSTAGTPTVATIDLSAPASPVACVLDAADYLPALPGAPGQVLSVFGDNLGPPVAAAYTAVNGMVPSTIGNAQVTFNGMPAPLLYASSRQLNVSVPFEMADQRTAAVEVRTDAGTIDSRTILLAPTAPSAFVLPAPDPGCAPPPDVTLAFAVNADGTLNTCDHPARAGSIVTIFLNGIGVTNPPIPTGTLITSPPPALNIPVTTLFAKSISATAVPGTVAGLGQVEIKVPSRINSPTLSINPSVNSVPVRDQSLTIWVGP